MVTAFLAGWLLFALGVAMRGLAALLKQVKPSQGYLKRRL